MKFLDKYKLYKNIMRQEPQVVIVHNNIILYDTEEEWRNGGEHEPA